MERSIKSGQIKLRELNVIAAGASGTPSALGFDRLIISQIEDLGVGNYKLYFTKPFNRECMLKGWSSMTAGVVECVVIDAGADYISVELLDVAGAAIDGDVALSIIGSDSRYDVA